MGWIGHAGLAGSRPGAGPSRDTLSAAVGLGMDWLELDICVAHGDVLVVRHHSRLPGGRAVHTLTVPELRRLEPDILTLSEAADYIGGHVALLIDVKSPRVIGPLAAWLASHRHEAVFAVCSESPAALAHMRAHVPWVQRWRSLTALWRWTAETVPPLLRPLLRDLFPGAIWNTAGGLADAGADIAATWTALLGTEHVAERMRRVLAIAERDRLPAALGDLAGEVGAAAVSVDHWAITRELCDAAHRMDVAVAAWTVNRIEVARDLARSGVDFITSDDVATMRPAVQALSRADAVAPGAVVVSCRPPGATHRSAPRLTVADTSTPRVE